MAVILLQKTCSCNSAWASALRLLLSSYSLCNPTSNPFLICGATYFATFPLLEDDCNTQIQCLSLPNNWAGKRGCQGMLLELTQHSCSLPQNLFFPSVKIMEMWCALISPSLDPTYFSLVRWRDLKYFFVNLLVNLFSDDPYIKVTCCAIEHRGMMSELYPWEGIGIVKEALNQWIFWNFKINSNEK